MPSANRRRCATAVPLVQRGARTPELICGSTRRCRASRRDQSSMTDGARVDRRPRRRMVALTRRHLERLFLDAVGLSPKRLARIARFQRALRRARGAEPRRRGAVTAAQCGYADQSHFIREFRQLAGCSPSEHLLKHGGADGILRHRRSAFRPSAPDVGLGPRDRSEFMMNLARDAAVLLAVIVTCAHGRRAGPDEERREATPSARRSRIITSRRRRPATAATSRAPSSTKGA